MDSFDLNLILFPLTMVLFFIVASLAIYLIVAMIKGKGKVIRAMNMSLFSVSLPKVSAEEKNKKPFKELVAVMEQFYASLGSLKEKGWSAFLYGQPVFTFEMAVPHIGEEISFYVACPRRLAGVMEKQVHGFFPEADVRPIEDYNIFNPLGASLGSYLFASQGMSLPFKTYQSLETDPLNEIANALSKLNAEGEGAAIQLIIRPTKIKRWRKNSLKIAREMQKGKQYNLSKIQVDKNWLAILFDLLTGSDLLPSKKEAPLVGPPSLTPLNNEVIKALENKANKVAYEANINLVVSAGMPEQASQLLLQLETAFSQFNALNLNVLKPARPNIGRSLKKIFYAFSFRMFDSSRRIILSTEELASIYHFPTTEVATPKVKFIKSKQAVPPANMPTQGLVLGKNFFRGVETIVRMQQNDRRRHLYIVGQTGTGKTSAMQGMLAQDVKTEGLGVIDPHGDFANYVLGCVPPERAEDVIYFNPADMERPLGLNMLEYDPAYPEQKTFIVNELISIFDKLYDLKTTGGPIFEQYTRNALQLLMDDPSEGATLMEVPRVLADAAYRKRLLDKCQNVVVRDFWVKEAEKAGGDAALANVVPYITSKFNTFIANDFMRPIIGQSKSAINFRDIMDNKKILIVNLSKGRIGDLNAYLLGLIIVGKLTMAAFSRVDMPEAERADFYLYIDEFQNFTTDSISTILSEARKYKLCLIITHQYIKQIPEKIRDAVFGNVGSLLALRVGAEDAEFLVKQFTPIFDQNDLINQDNFSAYAKLLINNLTSKPFNMVFERPPKENVEITEALKELSRLKYGRDKSLVESEISTRYKA
ncbi:MAG TPA: type IV secretion system DNA-binding domain-containing protein [Candidatus Portnoybacteria bacterium]|nr:type IV secretion system DNA-binding domain-containing protein [Candidatus Portnoybacteria bacterium]